MTCVHQRSEVNFCTLRPCFIDHLLLTSDFRQVPRRNLFQFSHSLSTAAFAAGIFMACGIGTNSCTKLSPLPAVWSSWWFGKDSPTRSLEDSLSSKNHASFDLISLDLPPIHNFDCSCLSCKAKREPLVFPISCEHSWWSLWIPCPPGQWNKCAFSSWGFSCDHLCLSFSLAFLPNFIQSSGHELSGLDVSCFLVSLSTDHKKSVWRFLFQTKFDVWGCSVHTPRRLQQTTISCKRSDCNKLLKNRHVWGFVKRRHKTTGSALELSWGLPC